MTSHQLEEFLKWLAQTGNVSLSARNARLKRSQLYALKASDPAFEKAWSIALEEATDLLQGEAIRRAIEGFEEVKYVKGEPVGTVRRYSDQLLMFLLKAHKPSIYGVKSGHDDSMEKVSHDHAKTSLLKKMEKLIDDDDGGGYGVKPCRSPFVWPCI